MASKLIGYMEFKSNKTFFKIREIGDRKDMKKTQIKTGSVCDNSGMKNTTIAKYIQNIIGDESIYKLILFDDNAFDHKLMLSNLPPTLPDPPSTSDKCHTELS